MLICLGEIRGHKNLFDIFGVFSRGFEGGGGGGGYSFFLGGGEFQYKEVTHRYNLNIL